MLLNQTWGYTVWWKMLLKTDAALDQTFPCCFSSPQFAGLYLWKRPRGSRIKILVWKLCESPYKWNSLESQTNVRINVARAYLSNKSHPVLMQSFTCLTRQKLRLVPVCLLPALSGKAASLSGCSLSEMGGTWVRESSCLGLKTALSVLQQLPPREGGFGAPLLLPQAYALFFFFKIFLNSAISRKCQESSITRHFFI